MSRAPARSPAPDSDAEAPSKTRLKKQAHDLQDLGEAVAALPDDRLADLPISERLRDAIVELRRTRSFEGRRRQVQYIGKLMKFEAAEPLREAVAAFRLGSARDTLALHQAETWREQLLRDDTALEHWLAQHPDTDTQQLRSLVRAARKDGLEPGARHGRAYRELFQWLRGQLQTAAPAEEPHDDE